jgi:hypothetical protein
MEVPFLPKLLEWACCWLKLLRSLTEESLLIAIIIYLFYLVILVIFGVLLGFLLGLSNRKNSNEPYLFLLLELLKLLYGIYIIDPVGFDNILLEPLQFRSLEPGNIEEFSSFSLQVIEPIKLRQPKIFLEKSAKQHEILFSPILIDPFLYIDINSIFEKSTKYKFTLFHFYFNVNQKIKS